MAAADIELDAVSDQQPSAQVDMSVGDVRIGTGRFVKQLFDLRVTDRVQAPPTQREYSAEEQRDRQ
jgi:hypothetical protein